MQVAGVPIDDTFAEAFPMTACRVIVTAAAVEWLDVVGQMVTGYATSVIGCDAEAAVERRLTEAETPDGRQGLSILFFAFSRDSLQKAVVNRLGQCVMTCPTTASFNGMPIGEKTINIGGTLRYFGDGWQSSKKLLDRRYWRIPVMDGEYVCEETFGTMKGVAGGNFIVFARTQAVALTAMRQAITAIRSVPEVICPFPGGLVRSGSKVGSRYKTLRASTNQAYCPTLRGRVRSQLPVDASAAYEVVIDGLSLTAVEQATAAGIRAAAAAGVLAITAGNYGGNLGPYHLKLHDLLTRY